MIAGVVAVQGRSLESAAAILIVSVGIGFEYQAGTLYAVFDGRERQQYVASTLIVNRISTALMGIGAAARRRRARDDRDPVHGRLRPRPPDRVLAHAPLRAAAEHVGSSRASGQR